MKLIMENWKCFLKEGFGSPPCWASPNQPHCLEAEVKNNNRFPPNNLQEWCSYLHDEKLFKESEMTSDLTNDRRDFALLWVIPKSGPPQLSNQTQFLKYINCLYEMLKEAEHITDSDDMHWLLSEMTPKHGLDTAYPEGATWRATKL